MKNKEYKHSIAIFYQSIFYGGIATVLIETIKDLAKLNSYVVLFTCYIYDDFPKEKFDNLKIIFVPNTTKEDFVTVDNINFIKNTLDSFNIKNIIYIDNEIATYPNRNKVKLLIKKANYNLYFWLHTDPFFFKKNRDALWINFHLNKYYKYIPKFIIPIIKKIDDVYIDFKSRKLYENRLIFFDKHILLCENFVNETNKLYRNLYKDKICSLINTIDINHNPNLEKKKEIVFVGRLSRLDKQVDRIPMIWEKIYKDLPDWCLKVYGGGFMKNNLIKYIDSHKLERISLEGYTQDVQSVYDNAAISILTSNYEGMPMSLCEAQNNGVIPVAFDCSGGIEFIIGKNNEAGILIEPFDIDKYAEELKSLCKDEERQKNLQRACLEKRNEYIFEKNIDTWKKIIETR